MSLKIWIIISFSLFVLGLVLGLATPAMGDSPLFQEIISLQELADFLASLPLPLIAVIIFIKNVTSLLFSFILSPVLCLLPIISLLFNGWIIGLVSGMIVSEESLGFLLAGLLPHGVFELPAFILGQAAALSFGTTVILAMFRRRSGAQMVASLKTNLKYLLISVALLVPAALIETFITPLLLK